MKPIIKIVVVGLGVRGKHWVHVINNHKLALITAFVDINPLSKEDVSKNYSQDIPFYTSLSDALDKGDCNVVLIATPPEYHYDQVILAFNKANFIALDAPSPSGGGEVK